MLNAYAKINLSLRVLHRRGDCFHELRSIFQTISLADSITLQTTKSRKTSVTLNDNGLGLADNLMTRAVHAYLEAAGTTAIVHMALRKQIPMGGGLGGGSTDAATVLLALHQQIKAKVDLAEIAAKLGSDVPFFLEGGTALGVSRGEELYPLQDLPKAWGVIAAPEVHVSTSDAYKALNRPELTSSAGSPKLEKFQALSRSVATGAPRSVWKSFCENDFEAAVFLQYPVLKQIRDQLERLGAAPARMTGSGAALFGLFDTQSKAEAAARAIPRKLTGCAVWALPFTLISRRRYQAQWR